jgi:hypothetical protein
VTDPTEQWGEQALGALRRPRGGELAACSSTGPPDPAPPSDAAEPGTGTLTAAAAG